MLKYTEAVIGLAEIPGEITLCINISNCPCHCMNCHSAYLAEDIGKPLDIAKVKSLIFKNKGISCIAFMGGDSEPEAVNKLAEWIKCEGPNGLKVAWYSGRQELSKEINLSNFDFIKLGPYLEEYGPLNYRTTNQRLYSIAHTSMGRNKKYDITYKFWRDETED